MGDDSKPRFEQVISDRTAPPGNVVAINDFEKIDRTFGNKKLEGCPGGGCYGFGEESALSLVALVSM